MTKIKDFEDKPRILLSIAEAEACLTAARIALRHTTYNGTARRRRRDLIAFLERRLLWAYQEADREAIEDADA